MTNYRPDDPQGLAYLDALKALPVGGMIRRLGSSEIPQGLGGLPLTSEPCVRRCLELRFGGAMVPAFGRFFGRVYPYRLDTAIRALDDEPVAAVPV